MFVYLSFLRPPPLHAKSNTPIAFTAQIANDLRTELWETPTDVYFHWISPSSRTRNVKLFTWKAETAYKLISVDPPPVTPNNRGWALCLTTCTSATANATVNFCASVTEPLPVFSIPIQFEFTASKTSSINWEKKTEEIERAFRFGGISPIVIREKTAFDLDKKIWDSGVGLGFWLTKYLGGTLNTTGNPHRSLHKVFTGEEIAVIELGAGTGLVSIVLATLLRKFSGSNLDKRMIWATDLASALEVINHNLKINGNLYPDISLQATELDWERELPEDILPHVNGAAREFDLIILADVTYNTDYFGPLVSTLERLLSTQTLVLLAYKERDPAERVFWELLREKCITMEQLETISGVGGAPVEIWLGKKNLSM